MLLAEVENLRDVIPVPDETNRRGTSLDGRTEPVDDKAAERS